MWSTIRPTFPTAPWSQSPAFAPSAEVNLELATLAKRSRQFVFGPRVIRGLFLARSGVYFLEAIPLTLISRFITNPELPPPTNEQLKSLFNEVVNLHDREAQLVSNGKYPFKALEIENPWRHFKSFLSVLTDSVSVVRRMQAKEHKVEAPAHEDLPEYYTRAFHFQTDGYLSQDSARRYDHQVEILFNGTAGAMRRLILPILADHAPARGPWLEVGCGTGSTTRSVLETFPKRKVTALDLSRAYLKVAQKNLAEYPNVDFAQGDATQLPFQDEMFSAVYSTYLFHELPSKERRQVITEALRVLKPGGILILSDSLQWDDNMQMNWALERFPKVYHEPFYKNYLHDPLEVLLGNLGQAKTHMEQGFLTKTVWIQKPVPPQA